MSRLIPAFMQMLAASVWLLALMLPAHAAVDAPDHVFYGKATLFGAPAPAGTAVEARTVPDNVLISRYLIGANSHLGTQYALRIPMDSVDPRTPGRARPGDPIRILLDGRLAAETAVGAEGVTRRLDLDPQSAGAGPAISIADAQVDEGDAGMKQVTLALTMNTTATRAVTVFWETRDGTATGGTACVDDVDFIRQSARSVTIPVGQMTGSLVVQVCGDTRVEPDESFTVELLSTQDDFGVFEKSTGTVQVFDDDDVPSLSVGSVRVAEPMAGTAEARFRASLSRTHDHDVSFTWATQNVSASAGSDYVAASGTATIVAGELDATLSVTILSDAAVESDETFRLVLSNPVRVRLPQTMVYGTIVDPRHDPALEQVDAQTGTALPDLDKPSAVVLSPDGAHAYAAGSSRNAIVHFTREADTGVLHYVASYKTSTSGFASAKLKSPQDLKISPDGAFLYVAALGDNAVTVLSRNGADGSLGFVESLVNDQMVGTLRLAGLGEVTRLALSPDGTQVYAVGRGSNAVVAFSRAESTGQLGYLSSLGVAESGLSALLRPSGIVVSADGAQVYVTARGGNAVFAFDRNGNPGDAQFGRLSLRQAYVDGLAGITSLKGALGLDFSPDGKQLYVAVEQDNGVVMFERGADGGLVQRENYLHGTGSLHGLRGAQAVEVSPDGSEVFVTGAADDSLTVFRRRASDDATAPGKLTVHRTLFKGDGGLNHLSVPGAMASSGDDRFLYVVANGGAGAIIAYRRMSQNVLFADGFE